MADWFDDNYDVVIIGGGAVGSGIALDASLRGYKTLLLEKNDFASGTSCKSTKLIHGGVRYLEKAVTKMDSSQYHLVKEALEERSYFINNAPHLSKPITLLTPIYKWFEIPYIYCGLYLYDFISGNKSIGESSFVFKDTILSSHPFIKDNNLYGGVKYYDGSFNDARMVIALLQTAQSLGCVVKNYHEVKSFSYENSKLSGINIVDINTLKNHKINGSCIINATGTYVDNIRRLDDNSASEILNKSSGIHLVVDKKFLNIQEGILIPKTSDNRVIFILPWQDSCLIGTTDNPEESTTNNAVTNEEISYLLEETNNYFDTKIQTSDILSSWKGYRPLIKDNSDCTSNIVREHHIYKSDSNLITIAGGKWTTYRKMSQDVLDFIVNDGLLSFKKKSETKDYKVIGSQNKIEQTSNEFSYEKYKMLINLYGDQTLEVLKIAKEEDANTEINRKFLYIKAQIIYSIRNEFVVYPLDFLARRTPMLLLDKTEALKSLEYVTQVMAQLLCWDEKKYEAVLHESQKIIETNRF